MANTSTLEWGSFLSSKHGGEGAMKDCMGPQDRRVSFWHSKDLRMMVSVAEGEAVSLQAGGCVMAAMFVVK